MTTTQSPTGKAGVGARLERAIEYEPNTGCWLSRMAGPNGYAQMKIGGRSTLVHRASWEIHRGPIPSGSWVLHRCDTPPCCNPDHLFLSSPADNSADMARKGRFAGGKMTPAEVRHVRSLLAAGRSARATARDYGVNPSTILDILNGRTWSHIS